MIDKSVDNSAANFRRKGFQLIIETLFLLYNFDGSGTKGIRYKTCGVKEINKIFAS